MKAQDRYAQDVMALPSPSFGAVRKIACNYVSKLPAQERTALWEELDRGVAPLLTHDLLCSYLYSYGKMHEAKMKKALKTLPARALVGDISIVDWGCGQGLATMCLFDRLTQAGCVKQVTLVDQCGPALTRANIHIAAYRTGCRVKLVEKSLNHVSHEDISPEGSETVFHLFSNILDVEGVDLRRLSQTVQRSLRGDGFVLSVSPQNGKSGAIDAFYNHCKPNVCLTHIKTRHNIPPGGEKPWTCKMRVFRIFAPAAYKQFRNKRTLILLGIVGVSAILYVLLRMHLWQ